MYKETRRKCHTRTTNAEKETRKNVHNINAYKSNHTHVHERTRTYIPIKSCVERQPRHSYKMRLQRTREGTQSIKQIQRHSLKTDKQRQGKSKSRGGGAPGSLGYKRRDTEKKASSKLHNKFAVRIAGVMWMTQSSLQAREGIPLFLASFLPLGGGLGRTRAHMCVCVCATEINTDINM